MSILGNALSMGGGTPHVVGYAWHTAYGTSYARVGNFDRLKSLWADSNFFTQSTGLFTCQRAGTYQIVYFGRGGYNSSGTSIDLYFQVVANGSVVASSYSVDNAGVNSSVTVTLSVGQTLYAQTRNSSGNNTHDFGFIIIAT